MTKDPVFYRIRRAYEAVAAQARHVSIRGDLIPGYAAGLPREPYDDVFDKAHHYTARRDGAIAYVFMLDAVNFGSGLSPDLEAEGFRLVDGSFYYSMATRLKNRFEEHGEPKAVELAGLTPRQCAEIFLLDTARDAQARLAGMYADALNQLGRFVSEKYDGSFLRLLDSADRSAERLVTILSEIDCYRDVAFYKGVEIPLLKRAQSTAADMQDALSHFGERHFRDIGALTMLPDNAVAHVLRVDGILEYSGELRRIIDASEKIPAGSEMEIEIRACAGQAVEDIAGATGLSAIALDRIFWHRSLERRYADIPAHRTATQFY